MTTNCYNIRLALLVSGEWCFTRSRYHKTPHEFQKVLTDYCPGEGTVLFQVWEIGAAMRDDTVDGLIAGFAGPVDCVRSSIERFRSN